LADLITKAKLDGQVEAIIRNQLAPKCHDVIGMAIFKIVYSRMKNKERLFNLVVKIRWERLMETIRMRISEKRTSGLFKMQSLLGMRTESLENDVAILKEDRLEMLQKYDEHERMLLSLLGRNDNGERPQLQATAPLMLTSHAASPRVSEITSRYLTPHSCLHKASDEVQRSSDSQSSSVVQGDANSPVSSASFDIHPFVEKVCE
jgi:hypothetical protein